MYKFKRFLSIINEMSFDKKIGEGKIRDLSEQILLHLIKILKWEDKRNYNKHLNDINTWLYNIQRIKINKKRLKPKRYYKLIYDEPIGDDLEYIDSTINLQLKKYNKLNIISNNIDIMNKINRIIKDVSLDISKNEFKDIRYYL